MKILLAGGGTGGHLFPGIAIAEALRRREAGAEICFVGRPEGIEARAVPAAGFRLETIEVSGLKGEGIATVGGRIVVALKALVRSIGIIRRFRPDLVVGLGAYVSGPVLLAARILSIPTAIQEQNVLPGWTNKILGRIVDRIFVAYEDSLENFPSGKAVRTGNPVRETASGLAGPDRAGGSPFRGPVRDEAEARAEDSSGAPALDAFHLLVFGGSRGSRGVNRMMAEALDGLGPLRGRLEVIHQAGREEREEVAHAYRRADLTARVEAFIDDMGSTYEWSDLVVCRAGALSLAELALHRKAAVLIPFPQAADDHQTKNACVLEQSGAALVVRESEGGGPELAARIAELADDPAGRNALSEAIARFATPNAAERIVDECLALIVSRRGKKGTFN